MENIMSVIDVKIYFDIRDSIRPINSDKINKNLINLIDGTFRMIWENDVFWKPKSDIREKY